MEGGWELEQAQRSHTVAVRAFRVASSGEELEASPSGGEIGEHGNAGHIPRKALKLQKSTRGILGPGAELPVSVRRTSCMGILLATPGPMLDTRFLLCKFRRKD